jgi:hypothetical protein
VFQAPAAPLLFGLMKLARPAIWRVSTAKEAFAGHNGLLHDVKLRDEGVWGGLGIRRKAISMRL